MRPKYIWTDDHGRGRNRYGLFRHAFTLGAAPASGVLHLFADTRYRLLVNGMVVGHGPARFSGGGRSIDTYELDAYLRPGRNTIAVLVNSAGAATFHSEKSVGGLIAWGAANDAAGQTVEIASDESWRAIESPGHRPETHYLSFALNAAEYLDARTLPAKWAEAEFDDAAWPAAVAHGQPRHWGRLRARSIPLLDEREVAPRRMAGAWAVRPMADEDRYSLFAATDTGQTLHTRARVAVLTWLHSPRAQAVTFGAWWGRYWVNGLELKPVQRQDGAYRQDFTAALREGWNLLQIYERVQFDWWDFFLAVPRAAGVEVSAEREVGSAHTFLIGGLWEGAALEAADKVAWPLAGPEALPAELGPWRRWARGKEAGTPMRARAWSVFAPVENPCATAVLGRDGYHLTPNTAEDGRGTRKGDAIAFLYDFGGEVLGRPVVEFTAAAGTVVDLSYTERRRPDGVADIHYRFFVDMMERYVAREGRQTWQTFHPRGMRWLEVLVRGDLARFELHSVGLTRAQYPVREVGAFACSDPLLNDLWRVGRDTQRACMEDAYLDCPHRERGLYSGDFLVQFFSDRAAFGDPRLFRRCIDLFLQAQGENGLIPGGCHGLPAGRHPDYSAILLQCLWQYWVATGDTAFLRATRGRVAKLLAGLEALRGAGNTLLDAAGMDAYIDLCHMDKTGVNCALNCFYQRGFADGARVLELAGEVEAARHYAAVAAQVAQAVREAFWDEQRGVFTDRRAGDVPAPEPSVPANALPLLYDLAGPAQAARAGAWLVEALLHNARVPDPRKNTDFNVTSYFAFYALGALFRHGRAADALEFMRRSWGPQLARGATTLWEYFTDGDAASLCHAWSSAPVHYLSSQVLGVAFPEPGNDQVVQIKPQPGGLAWAEGVYPHRKGGIRVRWERRGEGVEVEWEGPKGVEVRR